MGLTHEFGIMQTEQTINDRYDDYEPQKYNAITIHDDYILPLLKKFSTNKCYWHSLDREEFGIAYYGVTPIPQISAKKFLDIFQGEKSDAYNEIIELFKIAVAENKYIIHYGI